MQTRLLRQIQESASMFRLVISRQKAAQVILLQLREILATIML